MSSHIQIAPEVRRLADARAAAGYPTVAEYVRALILADAGEPITPELESHLLSALKTPAKSVTPAYWDEKRAKLAANRRERR